MNTSRRRFIKTIAVGIAGSSLLSSLPYDVLAKEAEHGEGIEIEKGFKILTPETQKTMEAMADAIAPGAKEIGIRDLLMDYFSKNTGIASFYDAGFWNLDAASRSIFKQPFHMIPSKEDRRKLLEDISIKNRQFFWGFRNLVIRFYYTHPAVWKRLGYAGPPQPAGFMDYHLPPKRG
ncbi:MAG: gluconate 2-dehydrogenase subunit 3 family protein [Candidatus Methanosuratincola sp.]|jgi:hypothetical protein